jgi:hypothetical protein
MRPISSDLAAVQKVRSPQARVSCTVEERGATHGARAVEWRQLVENEAQVLFLPCALVDTSDGRVLRFVDTGTSVRQHTINDPTDPDNWTTPSADTEILGHTAYALAALRFPTGDTNIRLFYINGSDGNVQYIQSSDNGASWASPQTVYSGGDASADLVIARMTGTGFSDLWFVGFSTFDSGTGIYRARFGNGTGSSWTLHEYPFNAWQAAGIAIYRQGLSSGEVRVLVYRQRANGLSRLRVLTYDGSTFSDASEIDRTSAGLVGMTLSNYRFIQLPEHDAQIAVAGESGFGYGAYEGVAGLLYDGELLVDETIMLPELRTTFSYAHTGLCQAGNDLYVAGTQGVWRGAWQGEPTSETLTPTRYDYDENKLDIDFPVSPGSMSLKVGQIIKVDRTLSWGNQSGTESVRFYIVKVSRATDKVSVVALDALGFMGNSRCRRSSIISEGGGGGVASAMRRAAARIGLGVDVDNSALEAAPVMGMSVAAAENLLSAAYRVGSQSEWYLVPANDGAFRLSMITPGTSGSGEYDDTPHEYGEANNEHPIYNAAELTDFRQLGFSHVLGTYSTDPQDGSALGMAAGAWVANTRPISFSLTNRTYNTFVRVENAAKAEGARQAKLDINAEMTSGANLALELHDVVEVTEPRLDWNARQFRVRRIQERWEKGKLTQRVWMGSED